jgi:hypothetical protein
MPTSHEQGHNAPVEEIEIRNAAEAMSIRPVEGEEIA